MQTPGIAPPRFETIEDGQLFMECMRDGKPFPKEKWIQPYALVDGKGVINKRYAEAPYEIGYFIQQTPTVVNCEDP